MEEGLTIECSGWVKLWRRKLNSPKEQTDSLLLKSGDQKVFDECMADTSLFRYSHHEPANHTATLELRTADRSTVIEYPSSDAPADLPPAAQRILSAIHNIHK